MPFDAPIHTNEANLERVLGAGLPVVLVFWQRGCGPCDSLEPSLRRVAAEYAGRVLIVKVDAGAESGLTRRYNVTQTPSSLLIKAGRTVATLTGALPETDLRAWVRHLLDGAAAPSVRSGPVSPLAGAAPAPSQGQQQPAPPAQPQTGEGKVVEVTDQNFSRVVLGSRVPVLVDFWATWCGPCRMVAPIVADLAREFAGRALVAKLDVDANPRTAGQYNVMSIPTLILFRDGKPVDQIVGAQPAGVLRDRLARQVGRT